MPDTPAAEPETIRWTVADGVGTVTLDRPESLNALNATMRRELLTALKAVARDASVRAVILTGSGRGFCAGADLRGGDAERDFRRVLTDEYNPLVTAIRELPKLVIAAVNGVAAGAGVSLALACDLVFAAEEARFIQAFVKIGLVPDSGSTRAVPPSASQGSNGSPSRRLATWEAESMTRRKRAALSGLAAPR